MTSWHRRGSSAILVLTVALVSIALSLVITPMQQVSGAGQTVQVGTAAPSWSLSGPAELDLFGQQIKTRETFLGPVRPQLKLTHISLSQQLADFAGSSSGTSPKKGLEDALVSGWTRYFFWQIAVVAIMAIVLLGSVSGWRRHNWKRSVRFIAIGLVVAEAINVGAIMVTAYTTPGKLSHVRSLQSLVGNGPSLIVPKSPGPVAAPKGNKVVVIGDSTAAGLGNRPLPHPKVADSACQRSQDSYARDLANANGWSVTNLACSNATIADGLLGPQVAGGLTVPAQIDNSAMRNASKIIVSVGANDVQWSNLLKVCAVSASCENKAAQAYFQQHVASFAANYLQLLSDLQLLAQHPRVLINLYYDPITQNGDCLTALGITTAKQDAILSRLAALNNLLSSGAKAAGFPTARPNFANHGLCSDGSWVQGVKASAPFHPNAAGQLAIALADTHALLSN